MDSITVLVRTFILISTDKKQIYINAMPENVIQFCCNCCCYKAYVSLNIKKLDSRSQQNACRFSCKVSAGVTRF